MPHYRIELTPQRGDKPGGNGVTDREERRFANLGEALDRAREMHRWQNASAKGFRIFNAAGELLHVWMPEGNGVALSVTRKAGPTPYAYWKRRGARR